ncbi:MAG: baseplate J/gp47 family protein [Plesiomonas shigelloides]
MAEITPAGYKLKTQNEWFDEERQLYLDIDPLWNLDPSTPDGLKLAHDAEVFGALDEVLQQAYNSKDPAKAVGYDLDVLCALTGTTRSKGTPSNVTVTLTGTPGTVVAAGSLIKSRTTGTGWTIDQTVTLTAGTATVGATCTVVGPTQADAGTLTQIATTVGGWTGVTNPSPATPGTDAQDDASLRIERNTAVGRPGNNQVDSTLGELYAVAGVRRVKAYENDTGVTDSNGLPPHSMSYIVDGGTDADVAMAIYVKKNPGVALYQAGTPVSVTVTSPKYPTNQKVIKFSRPIAVDMVITVTVKNDGSLPSTVADEIKDAIVQFGAGTLIDPECGFVSDGFDIGESVPYFTVSTPVNKVLGSYGNSYIQTLTVNGGAVNVAVPFNKISRWTSGNITVTIV